jgi:pimeloyl-ACP methyl ester carboxylesterase
MRLIGILALAAIVGVPTLLWLSARLSLDTGMHHTSATRSLPMITPSTTQGLVRIAARDFEFRARVAGLGNDGPGVILLHGFPETSIMWEPLIERAAASGFRVVAFDQRGYSPDARPAAVAAYAMPELIGDVMGVADAVGFDRFHLVGHDWGSGVGWSATALRPDRVLSWASLSIPHPKAIFEPGTEPTPPTYIRVFRISGLAEALFGFGDRWVLNALLYSSMSEAHRAEYNAVFSEPGALTATLNWYRAIGRDSDPLRDTPPVRQPVLYVYGKRDIPAYVNPQVQARLVDHVAGPFESIALDAGHWLIQDEEKVVVDALMKHLEAAPTEPARVRTKATKNWTLRSSIGGA